MRKFVLLLAGLVLVPGMLLAESAPKVPVRAKPLRLVLGQTLPLQLSNHQPIRTVLNENPGVVEVAPVPEDLTTVLLTARALGRARVTLIGQDGKREVRQFGR